MYLHVDLSDELLHERFFQPVILELWTKALRYFLVCCKMVLMFSKILISIIKKTIYNAHEKLGIR